MIPGKHKELAFTLVELLVVIASVALLALTLLPVHAGTRATVARISCSDNLKRIGEAFQQWADANYGRYPMKMSASAGSGMPPLYLSFYTYRNFVVLSNDLLSPRFLICPTDERRARTNFLSMGAAADFTSNLGLSYFAGRDSDRAKPRMFLTGDRNIYGPWSLATDNNGYGNSYSDVFGATVALRTNSGPHAPSPGWTSRMHDGRGNICLTDGSVQMMNSMTLRDQLNQTGDSATLYNDGNTILFP